MTTTNRAFIKAYRQDAAEPATGGDNTPARPNEPPAAKSRAAAGATAPSIRSGSQVANATLAIDPSPAHSRSQIKQLGKQPLSSFMPGKRSTLAASPEPEFLRAGTIVAKFHWPAVCRSLMLQCREQLDRVINVLSAEAAVGRSLVGVMGMYSGDGATTTSLCLAARAAAAGHRVILVDGDLASPRIASSLEVVPTAGWEDVLDHKAPLADAVVEATDDRLALLALGSTPHKNLVSLATGLQATATAGVLRHAYELVLMDVGTFFDTHSQPVLLELVRTMSLDAVIAVAGGQPADRRDLATIAEQIGEGGCQLLGTIENRLATPKAA
jgi:Mrp family chromosome partitioning ATPase